jgi:hypothetical protein
MTRSSFRRTRLSAGTRQAAGSSLPADGNRRPYGDPGNKAELDNILHTNEQDNCTAWDMQPDGQYIRRHPTTAEAPRGAQQVFIENSTNE